MNTWGGFTWGRDNPVYLRSRLDMIITSSSLKQCIKESHTYKTCESDHHFLHTTFDIDSVKQGKGITRVNASLLKDSDTLENIKSKLLESINEMDSGWNPHMKLDFIKVKIRDYMLEIGREKMREEKSALFHTNKEINALQKRQEEILIQLQNATSAEDFERIKNTADNITSAIDITKAELEPLKKKEAERLIFRSRAQWTEEGEKSSRYFLNLIKDRQNKMLIRKIISNGTTFHKQDEITKAITNFYKDLYLSLIHI